MADTKFTILGTSGSGKTCYLLGSYKAMTSKKVPDFSLEILGDSNITFFNRNLRNLRSKEAGNGRYPEKTNSHVESMRTFQFNLLYNTEKISNFELVDYAGDGLTNRNKIYTELEKSISVSTVLYIIVDGKMFQDEDEDERKENFEYDCVYYIQPIIQKYARNHNGQLPPIVFIVTKLDLLKDSSVTNSEISSLIKGYFKSAFSEGNTCYIVGTTLGENISDDENKGKFEPVNMHLPVLIGAYHEFYDRYILLKEKIEKANDTIRDDNDLKSESIFKEQKRWKIFRDEDYIRRCRKAIESNNQGICDNNKLLKNDRTLLIKLGEYLKNNSGNFMFFVDGNIQNFKTFI